jgi:hypothetical protein
VLGSLENRKFIMQTSLAPKASQDSCRRVACKPSRLLMIEKWILCGAIVAVGFVYLSMWLPKPSVPAAVARSMEKLRSPFTSKGEKPVAAIPASRAMVAAIKRAERLEQRGHFDDATRAAWKRAAGELHRFGAMPVACGRGRHVRLFLKEAEEERMEDIAGLLEQLMPGRFAALEARRIAAIEADPLGEATTPPVTWFTVAANAPEEVREMATSLAAMHEDAAVNARIIAKYRDMVGYDYWRAICQSGASAPGFEARSALWRAAYVARQAQLEQAKAAYEEGFEAWHAACGVVPALATNPHVAEEMRIHDAGYRAVLAALHAPAGEGDTAAGSLDL